jgi:hypothetical protein
MGTRETPGLPFEIGEHTVAAVGPQVAQSVTEELFKVHRGYPINSSAIHRQSRKA